MSILRLPLLSFALAAILLSCVDRRAGGGEDATDDDDASDDDDATDDDDDDEALPSAPVLRIEPLAPSAGDALICFVDAPSVDPLGRDVQYAFTWDRLGVDAGVMGAVVDAGTTAAGETWGCIGVPSAEGDVGPAGRAEVLIAQANRPPEAPQVSIDPPSPRANQAARCALDVAPFDPDGDVLTVLYEWRMNGIGQGITDPILPPSATLEGQTWTCAAWATDGELTGPEATASATVLAAAWTPDVTGAAVAYSESSCFACPGETWYIGDKAFDDNTGTAANSWHATWTGGPEWVGLDFGEGADRVIGRYGLMGAAFHPGYRAVDWQLQGSADGASWATLHTVTGANLVYVMWGGEPFTYYELDNVVPYQHYRIFVTVNAGGQQFADEVGIVEIEMFEAAP